MNFNIFNNIKRSSYILKVLQMLLISYILLPYKAQALEIYSLVKAGCDAQTGLIVYTDEDSIHMLNVEGKLSILKRKDIEIILVYNIHDNPIKVLDLESGLKNSLKEVYVDDIEKTHFIGWPIRFIENLIMFYDVDGKTHLVDVDKIKTFREAPSDKLFVKEISNYKDVTFTLGDNLPECKTQMLESKKYTEPTRMISDRIRVHKFFSVYSTGFTYLKRFQRKTMFYAKPFLYEKETKLGFYYLPDYRFMNRIQNEINHMSLFPLYLQWSSGSHYGSQGEYSIGSKPVDVLPTVEPQLSVQSDIKSHFLTGTFVGNPLCLTGGSECLLSLFGMTYFNFYEQLDKSEHNIYTQFNYLVLTGVEFQEYSFSAGFYYPVFGIVANEMFREITSTKSSPMVRFMHVTKDLSVRVIYSWTHLNSNSPSEDGMGIVASQELPTFSPNSELLDFLNMYDLETEYLRVNINYDITDELNIGISEVVFQGEYKENFFAEDYKLDFLHFTSSLSIRQGFSEYTAIKAEVNHFLKYNDYISGGITGDSDENEISVLLSIEFFL